MNPIARYRLSMEADSRRRRIEMLSRLADQLAPMDQSTMERLIETLPETEQTAVRNLWQSLQPGIAES